MKIVHVVVTDNFAGAERYVVRAAVATSVRGHEVSVVGGRASEMREGLGPGATWLPGSTLLGAIRSMLSLGRQDVCHVHMTLAEAAGALLRPMYGSVVSTRHFAQPRGSSRIGGLVAPLIARAVDQEISISSFVAESIESPGSTVLLNGVPEVSNSWSIGSRMVLVMQRLEREKDTKIALRAWKLSELATNGWDLVVAGDGAQRGDLESLVRREQIPGVRFTGWVSDVDSLLRSAGIFLATAPNEPFGLSVAEAMMRGVPVVAAGSGGHLETLGGAVLELLFEPGNAAAAARLLRTLGSDHELRRRNSDAVHEFAQDVLGLERHMTTLLPLYGTPD